MVESVIICTCGAVYEGYLLIQLGYPLWDRYWRCYRIQNCKNISATNEELMAVLHFHSVLLCFGDLDTKTVFRELPWFLLFKSCCQQISWYNIGADLPNGQSRDSILLSPFSISTEMKEIQWQMFLWIKRVKICSYDIGTDLPNGQSPDSIFLSPFSISTEMRNFLWQMFLWRKKRVKICWYDIGTDLPNGQSWDSILLSPLSISTEMSKNQLIGGRSSKRAVRGQYSSYCNEINIFL